jgi:hypothetical protein
MGSSTIQLQEIVDSVSVMADIAPQANPTGYDATTCLAIGQDVMSALIAKRFNWKWNAQNAAPFLTNTWTQDYPQLGLYDVGWVEDGLWIDINNTQLPQPNGQVQSAKDLAWAPAKGAQYQGQYPARVAWYYNRLLIYGVWPGATVVYTPLLGTTPTAQNPTMNIRDSNGNLMILTQFGTTGATPPTSPANSKPGTVVDDGSCKWTIVDPFGQGWRLDILAPPTGPVYEILVKYQAKAIKFKTLQDLLDPIPDDYAHHFRTGYKAFSYAYSSDAKTRSQFEGPNGMKMAWLESMAEAETQGDREPDAFMMYPATRIVQPTYGVTRNPRDPGQPY